MFRMRRWPRRCGPGERGVIADEGIFENLHAEGLCKVPFDIGAVEVFVTELVSEDLDDGVFEIGFGEGHGFTFLQNYEKIENPKDIADNTIATTEAISVHICIRLFRF